MMEMEKEGLYIMSVAARMLGMHPQTLRKYERAGFIKPARTGGMMRLYSAEDIMQLRFIKHLVEDLGLNLAGVEVVLNIVWKLSALRNKVFALKDASEGWEEILSGIEEILNMVGYPTT